MKYSRSNTTRSELLRHARRQWRERGTVHVIAAGIRIMAAEMRRALITTGRYAHWVVLTVMPAGRFIYQGEEYVYFRHPYNATWRNERAVEVPILRRAIEKAGNARILEFGNVLGYYLRHEHDVVDKYEPAPNILNVDIVEFRAERPYDLIVSASTLEHVGWDDEEREPGKIPRAVRRLRSLLAPGGRAIVTLPLGYNHYLDEMLRAGTLGLDDERYLLRVGRGEWREVKKDDLGRPEYGNPFPGANGLVIGLIKAHRLPSMHEP
jgi:hypothetical protein